MSFDISGVAMAGPYHFAKITDSYIALYFQNTVVPQL